MGTSAAKRQAWIDHVAEWCASGQTQRAYCVTQELSYHAFGPARRVHSGRRLQTHTRCNGSGEVAFAGRLRSFQSNGLTSGPSNFFIFPAS